MYEHIMTTEAKAKEVKNYIDQVIKKAKTARNTASRRLAMIRELQKYIPAMAVKKLLGEFSVRFEGRTSGYTRVTKLEQRKSDSAKMAVIEFV